MGFYFTLKKLSSLVAIRLPLLEDVAILPAGHLGVVYLLNLVNGSFASGYSIVIATILICGSGWSVFSGTSGVFEAIIFSFAIAGIANAASSTTTVNNPTINSSLGLSLLRNSLHGLQ